MNKKWLGKIIERLAKTQLTLTVLGAVLLFYAAGIELNLFASSIFSGLFVVSYDTAHYVIGWVAVSVSVVLISWALILEFMKKGKIAGTKKYDDPVIPASKASSEDPMVRGLSTSNQCIVKEMENVKNEIENKPIQQPINQPTTQKAPEIRMQTNTSEKTKITLQRQAEYMISCPTCKKEFIQPQYLLDNSGSKPKLNRQCPYCNQFLYS